MTSGGSGPAVLEWHKFPTVRIRMLRLFRLIALALLLVHAAGVAAEAPRNLSVTPARAAPRVALVIGNAGYPGIGALKNPANDARDVAAKLKTLGFEVILRTDVRLKDMLRAMTEFGERLQGGSEALFFYAGHGMQVRGRNYLIPIDAEIRSESAVGSEAVDVDQLLDKLAPARLSMVILDACRNNPFERRFRGGGQGLAQINAPTGTMIAYATAPGKVAADGEGRNGLYTAELLAAMDVPGAKIEDVFKRVRANVVRKSSEAQVPWESSSLTGDFYFRPGGGAASTSAPPAPVDNAALELAFWESASRGNSVADYRAYLERYPNGQFAELARNRLRQGGGGMQLASIAPSPAATRAPLTAFPAPHVGDTWRYRGINQNGPDNPAYRVNSVDDAGRIEIGYASNIGEQMTLIVDRDWNPLVSRGQRGASEVKFEPVAPYHQFPLEPGKKWRGTYKGECGALCSFEVDYEYEVRNWETVTVPAGTFEALRIESRDNYRHIFGMASLGLRTTWVVPEIAQPVKFRYVYDGKRLHEYELESYQPAP